MPTFYGDTIAYPEFKRIWQKVAGSYWDKDKLEQLKFKVDSHTKRIVSSCKTMTEVLIALDNEYAQEEEIVNAQLKILNLLNAQHRSESSVFVTTYLYLKVL